MPRKTVKIEIPKGKIDDVIKLGTDVLGQHTDLAADSPLDKDRMKMLKDALTEADTANKDFNKFDAKAQSARSTRDQALGTEAGRDVNATVLAGIVYARDQLLIAHKGNEKEIGEYGF